MADEAINPQMETSWAGAVDKARLEATAGRSKNPKTSKTAQPTDEHKAIADIADELSKPEYWDGLVRGPADYMLATTGRKLWDIPDKEVRTISTPLAFSVKTFIHLDPRVIAAILLLANIGKVYGPRAVQEYNIRKAEALDKVEKREVKS